MPPHKWKIQPDQELWDVTNAWGDPEASALLAWATWTVDSLHYLVEIDDEFAAHERKRGFDPHTIDIAHVRWATSTAITALDLCVAAVARLNGLRERKQGEMDLGDFNPKRAGGGGRAARKRLCALPEPAREWIEKIVADPDFELVSKLRDPLVHHRVRRQMAMPRWRTRFSIKDTSVDVPAIIQTATRLATAHVEEFLAQVVAGRIAP
jgi:hypothetical protein